MKNIPMVTRLVVSLLLAGILAITDIWLSSSTVPDAWDIHGGMFWFMFLNRLSIGFFVAIAGVVTLHPLLGFRMRILRGIFVGIWISLPMASSIFIEPNALWSTFLAIVVSGAVYGAFIDSIATRITGDGKRLLHPNNG